MQSYTRDPEQIQRWMDSARFKGKKRVWNGQQVANLRPSVPRQYPSAFMSDKLWNLLAEKSSKGSFSHTFGCLDPVQVVQMGKYLSTIYISGEFFFFVIFESPYLWFLLLFFFFSRQNSTLSIF